MTKQETAAHVPLITSDQIVQRYLSLAYSCWCWLGAQPIIKGGYDGDF
jgi:hypothetical protein